MGCDVGACQRNNEWMDGSGGLKLGIVDCPTSFTNSFIPGR